MKLETRHKNIGKKAHPALEDLLNGKISIDDVPDCCMIWQGKKTKEGSRYHRSRGGIAYTFHRAYALMTHEGKTLLVHRWIYEQVFGSLGDEKLENDCSNSTCVNPKHWRVRNRRFTLEEDDEDFTPVDDLPWTLEDAEGVLDVFFTYHEELDLTHPDIAAIPKHLLEEALIRRGSDDEKVQPRADARL